MLKITDNVQKALRSIDALVTRAVLVGIPAASTERKSGPLNNATIGYIQENGSPVRNIPARPFLLPGVAEVQSQVAARFGKAAAAALVGNESEVEKQFNAAGLIAQNSVRGLINDGIAPALSEATLRARARRGRKGAIQELNNRAAGQEPSIDLAKPLIDTGQLRNSITYVIRRK